MHQALTYAAQSFATTAKNTIRLHFRKRVLAYVKTLHPLPEDLCKDDKKAFRLQLLHAAHDICACKGTELKLTDVALRGWVAYRRDVVLGIGELLQDDKPLEYRLKESPIAFLKPMHIMLQWLENAGKRLFSLLPSRRCNVPRHFRVDMRVLQDLGIAPARKKLQKRTVPEGKTRAPKRSKAEMFPEKEAAFASVIDLKRAGVRGSDLHNFAYTFSTDEFSAHLQFLPKTKAERAKKKDYIPRRGVWCIDKLKEFHRVENFQNDLGSSPCEKGVALDERLPFRIIGVDPGKRELISCMPLGCDGMGLLTRLHTGAIYANHIRKRAHQQL